MEQQCINFLGNFEWIGKPIKAILVLKKGHNGNIEKKIRE